MLGSPALRTGALLLSTRVDSTTDEMGLEAYVATLDDRLSGGALNAALANEVGKLIADFTGRGATRSRAFIHTDVVVCLFEDSATRAERTLVAAGRSELVRQQRDALQRVMESTLTAAVERL